MVGDRIDTPGEAIGNGKFYAPYRLVTQRYGVPFTEEESGLGSFSWEGGEVSSLYRVPWQYRGYFLQELLGGIQYSVLGTTYTRIPPDRYFQFPWLYCKRAEIVDGLPKGNPTIGAYNQLHHPGGCRIRAHYASPDFDQSDESINSTGSTDEEIQLATLLLDYSAEMLTLPERSFGYAPATGVGTTAVPGDTHVAIRCGQIQLSYARHFVRTLPGTTIDALAGKVNASTFAGLAAETVLFLGAQAKRIITMAGAKAWELTYLFKIRTVRTRKAALAGASDNRAANVPAGWNRVFISNIKGVAVNDWVKIYALDNTSQFLYETGNFASLFDPNAT